ncbi:MAG: Rossmann-like domain-containing protein [Pseudorhodobacter sp.]
MTFNAQTLATARAILGPEAESARINRATLGLFFIAVTLDTGETGLCATPLKEIPEAVCCPSSAMSMPFPGKLEGKGALRLAEEAISQTGLRRALGIAALNALASRAAQKRTGANHKVLENTEAFDVAAVQPDETAVVVGAFGPFLKALRKIGAQYFVLEKDPATLRPEEMPHYRAAETYGEIVPEADVLLITGTTLINDTLGDLIACAKPTARVVLVGPTVPILPDAFLDRPGMVLGTVRVTDAPALHRVLAEGGSGYHFFGKSTRKIVLVPEDFDTKTRPHAA